MTNELNDTKRQMAGFFDKLSPRDMTAKIERSIVCWRSKGMGDAQIRQNLSEIFDRVSPALQVPFKTAQDNAFKTLNVTAGAPNASRAGMAAKYR